jgi:hypothetical protein
MAMALRDFVEDLIEHTDVFLAERDHLAPNLERKAKALERLQMHRVLGSE